MRVPKLEQPPELWDRLYAPASCVAIITTVDRDGSVNAASYATCVRVSHKPVHIAFTTNLAGKHTLGHTASNVRATGEFVVNLPIFDRAILEKVRIVALPFARGVNELEKAGLTTLPATRIKPPRILECARHFECEVEWTKEWLGRLMVVGKVVAASVDADKVDDQGYVLWDRIRPAYYCGVPYGGGMFAGACETMVVDMPYEGPETEFNRLYEKATFES
jgi:flavin reductase (DIM6/NTAB) family NADH-FMN oxidoreductase RutF